jgi:hypothetical protein
MGISQCTYAWRHLKKQEIIGIFILNATYLIKLNPYIASYWSENILSRNDHLIWKYVSFLPHTGKISVFYVMRLDKNTGSGRCSDGKGYPYQKLFLISLFRQFIAPHLHQKVPDIYWRHKTPYQEMG